MIYLLIFLSVVVFTLALPHLKSTFQIHPSPDKLDLTSVRDALVEKLAWSIDRANAAQTEYVRFLTLLQLKPGFMLIPWSTADGQDDLDQFWHQHILDTAKYAADCQLLFGRLIHHNPHVVRGSEPESDAVDKTRRLYNRTFNADPDGGDVNPIFLSSCSSCAAPTCDSGHSSCDGGGSHGDGGGGHSCGGHSCGGHGCGGSGCGGH